MSDSVERNSAMASIKLDLPEPFAPINTLSGKSGIAGVSGPNERRFTGCRECNKTGEPDVFAFEVVLAALFVLICHSQ